MSGPDHYGALYWCVKTDLSESGEIYLHADRTEIVDGILLFWRETGDGKPFVNLAIAPGQWRALFAASVMDGHAVAVEHWAGEVSRPKGR